MRVHRGRDWLGASHICANGDVHGGIKWADKYAIPSFLSYEKKQKKKMEALGGIGYRMNDDDDASTSYSTYM